MQRSVHIHLVQSKQLILVSSASVVLHLQLRVPFRARAYMFCGGRVRVGGVGGGKGEGGMAGSIYMWGDEYIVL